MKILVRGDCCSRRAFMLNRQKFDFNFTITSNEKAPNAVFCDTLKGVNPDRPMLDQYIDTSKMGKSQLGYFERQFERSVLDETDAALLVMDPYSEMNFQLWKHRGDGWRFWVPRQAIRDQAVFDRTFELEGYRTLEQSLEDAIVVINHIRKNNPEIPVLILPQPVEYYPKLGPRSEYYTLGKQLAPTLPGVFAGDVLQYSDLVPEDLGTGGGPEFTLHFSGDTYFKMMEHALMRDGLLQEIMRRQSAIDRKPSADSGVNNDTKRSDRVEIALSLKKNSADCIASCNALVDQVKTSLQQYWDVTDANFARTLPVKYDCAVILLDDYHEYAEYEGHVKQSGKGSRIRLIRRAEREGFFCERFVWKMHIPDIFDVNTSKEVRSGGAMKSSYLRTIEELGGAPTKLIPLTEPKCPTHWSIPFGVFIADPGHRQGTVEVGRRLLGYIFLRRYGEFALYSLILGHGDYLNHGVIIQLHHHVMRWLLDRASRLAQGIKVLMYAGIDQGNDGLREWKRRERFLRAKLVVTD